jgi:hypothetical protein
MATEIPGVSILTMSSRPRTFSPSKKKMIRFSQKTQNAAPTVADGFAFGSSASTSPAKA